MQPQYQPFAGVEAGAGVPGQVMLMGPDQPFIFTNLKDFHKAVTAGAQVSPQGLTGGGALRLQSIEGTLLRTVQEQKHFVLFNRLEATNATATVDEFSIKTRIGGYPGSGFNTETGDIADTQGEYERRIGIVKFLMTKREVSVVQESQKTLVDTIADQKVDATVELKTTIEWGLIYGDSAVNPEEFDGFLKQVTASGASDLIKDARGQGLSMVAQEVIDLAAAVAGYGKFGQITDAYCSLQVGAQEFDQKLDPALRVALPGRGSETLKLGTPVSGINTSHGVIGLHRDIFIQESEAPWEARSDMTALITASGLGAVTPVVASAVAASSATSQFLTAHAGTYYYGVEAINRKGRSNTGVSGAVVVLAGDKVTVTITNPNAGETGFVMHRSRRNGLNPNTAQGKADLRQMVRIAKTAGVSTVFVDENADIPGTSPVLLMNLQPGDKAITMRRLLPMTMFPLYPTAKAVRPWAQLIFLYLRIAKPKQHAIIKNVLPTRPAWNPF